MSETLRISLMGTLTSAIEGITRRHEGGGLQLTRVIKTRFFDRRANFSMARPLTVVENCAIVSEGYSYVYGLYWKGYMFEVGGTS